MPLVYVFDGSFDSFWNCVYDSYIKKEIPDAICIDGNLQCGFEQYVHAVEGNSANSLRVQRGFAKACGQRASDIVRQCFLSFEHERMTWLFQYIRLGFERGSIITGMLAHPSVLPVEKMRMHIGNEVHRFHQFVRFSQMANGVYYARIQPLNNVVPLIMPHFADRYNDQPFLIYDPGNGIAGVYDLNDWYLVETDSLQLPEESEAEQEWKALWKQFYSSITIQQRRNEKLRRSFCPKRYWADMMEMPTVIRR